MVMAFAAGLGETAHAAKSDEAVFAAMEAKGCTISGNELFRLEYEDLGRGLSYAYRFHLKYTSNGRIELNLKKDTATLRRWGKCK
jgi:hypothetical protein